MDNQKIRDDSVIEIAAGIGRGKQKRDRQYQSKNDPVNSSFARAKHSKEPNTGDNYAE
jgi:hypothetical protein